MWRKYCLCSLICIFTITSLSACSGGGETDPYALVTLHQATQGQIVSKGFKYRFENPQVIQLNDHLGLIREGNLIEFISGRSLESRLEGISGNYQLCVVKEYSPFVHFRVDKIYTEVDTVFISQAGAINYPRVFKEDEFGHEDYAETDLDRFPYNRTTFLRNQVDKKFYVTCRVEKMEEEGEEIFVLSGDNSKLKVVDPPDGIAVMLKVLLDGNYPFEGGIIFSDVEESLPYRKSTGIVGSSEINFIKYGNTIVSI